MRTTTQNRVEAVNRLVAIFQRRNPDIDIYSKSNSTRSVVSSVASGSLAFAIYRSNAAYKRFYGSGGNSYRVYINRALYDFIVAQSRRFDRYSCLAA